MNFFTVGSTIFNGIVQLCVFDLGPALRNFLGLESGSKQPPHKCKKFVKVKAMLRTYFNDIMKACNLLVVSNYFTKSSCLKLNFFFTHIMLMHLNLDRVSKFKRFRF